MTVDLLTSLDPLTADEIETAARLLRAHDGFTESMRFITLTLDEPDKRDPQPGRRVNAVLYDRARRATYECAVSLVDARVDEWRLVENVQPLLILEDYERARETVRADPGCQEALRRRGITDLDSVEFGNWTAGWFGPADDAAAHRLLYATCSVKTPEGSNHHARPIEGLAMLVDVDTREVVELQDTGSVPIPGHAGEYAPERMGEAGNWPRIETLRADVKPLDISQSDGPSFQLDGYRLTWQKWSLRVGFDAREGLVLHDVGYEDGGRVRSILRRASMSEMWVPYGDPGETSYRRNFFDAGEVGLGLVANSLELGCDCLGEIRYLDAAVNDADGHADLRRNVICIHEEDVGIGWKHTDGLGNVEVRRMRRLVVSSIYTLGNYDYGQFWHLYQDGSIECEIKLTGIVATSAVAPGTEPQHGTLVAPGLHGAHHQHWFSFRLDIEVDGVDNSVYEIDSEPAPDGDNPWGNAWVVKERLLERESSAQSSVDASRARYWKIVNPHVTNGLGQPVAYKLVPGDNAPVMHRKDAPALARAGFARHHVWVTRYAKEELWAAGAYPNQHPGGAGLPEYAAADRPLESTDVVVWYSCASHHVVRPEDWPVMPVARISFALRPAGFFDGNPALDLPRPAHCTH